MKIVAYYRVSTKSQGQSGLGLEAQRSAVALFSQASSGAIISEFTEVESGRKNDRPQLAAALELAKATGATLVIAKLDRLGRNVAFLSALMESGAQFVAADNPSANKLTLHILAAVAEAEADMISRRTKEGLAESRRKGTALGAVNPKCRNLDAKARAKGQESGGEKTRQIHAKFRAAMLAAIRQIDAKEPGEIAKELNARGLVTARGRAWTGRNVLELLRKADQNGGHNHDTD